MKYCFLIGGVVAMATSLIFGGVDTCPWTALGFGAGAAFATGLQLWYEPTSVS
jgi:hypothetical protein